jgi:hypothetical protein
VEIYTRIAPARLENTNVAAKVNVRNRLLIASEI